mmetsp:Transcript_25995/g.41741  ORF Transcript_25995/g.41741 Transcript_25995/m.41741 type:complete len:201 (-) Transcript_25995:472-1074(-)
MASPEPMRPPWLPPWLAVTCYLPTTPTTSRNAKPSGGSSNVTWKSSSTRWGELPFIDHIRLLSNLIDSFRFAFQRNKKVGDFEATYLFQFIQKWEYPIELACFTGSTRGWDAIIKAVPGGRAVFEIMAKASAWGGSHIIGQVGQPLAWVAALSASKDSKLIVAPGFTVEQSKVLIKRLSALREVRSNISARTQGVWSRPA